MFWSDAMRTLHGVDETFDPSLEAMIAFYTDDVRPVLQDALQTALSTGQGYDIEAHLMTGHGRLIRVRTKGSAVNPDHGAGFLVGSVEEAPSGTEDGDLPQRTQDILQDIVETLPSGVIVFDSEDRHVLHNKAYVALFPGLEGILREGLTLTEMLAAGVANGVYAAEIRPDTPRSRQLQWIEERAAQMKAAGPSREIPLNDGRWIQTRERRGGTGNLICVHTDITRLKQAEAEARRRANEDPLTGIPNRRPVFEKLEAYLNWRRKGDVGGAFALFDLDHFKQINDRFGHDAGDALLMEIAARARLAIRDGDMIGRIGGDEFALILAGVDNARNADLAVSRIIQKLTRPMRWKDQEFLPSLSLGYALYPKHGSTPSDIYRAADAALYQVKRGGRNGFRGYDGQT
jgi:diguanylate cyclase (GGDEF)-like protein